MYHLKRFILTIGFPIVQIYWRVFKPKTFGARMFILTKDRKKVLLIKNHNSKKWSLPGGHRDRGESFEDCAIREAKEEVGIAIEKTDYRLGTYTSTKEGKRDTLAVFVAFIDETLCTPQWELDDVEWINIEDVNTSIAYPSAMRRMSDFLSGKREIEGEW